MERQIFAINKLSKLRMLEDIKYFDDNSNLYDVPVFLYEKITKEITNLDPIIEENCVDNSLASLSPIEIFQLFFTEDLFEFLTNETNNYSISKPHHKSRNITIDEMKNFIYIYIFSSVLNLPEMKMLWNKDEYYTTIIPKIMSSNRFFHINSNFHIQSTSLSDGNLKDSQINEKTQKFKQVLDYLNEKWVTYYQYAKYLTIDECMSEFKGRICFRQTLKDKKKQTGIKFFAKSSASKGYVYNLVPYTGKDFRFNQNIGIGASVLCDFAKPHIGTDVHITFDNFYTTMYVINFLNRNNIKFTATLNNKRKCFPSEIKTKDLKGEEEMVLMRMDKTNIRFLIYKGRKQVNLVSNVYNGNMKKYKNKNGQEKIKPEMIAVYNLTKSGVDQVDAASSIYSCQRKTYKWWKAVFFYLLDVTIHNACVIYFSKNKQQNSKMLFFRKYLYEQWFKKYILPKSPFDENSIHHLEKTIVIRDCFLCSNKKNGGLQEVVFRTHFICNICKIYLCHDCFKAYHNY